MEKVILAYSGGLDTSVCIHWLRYKKGCRVVAVIIDLGQGEYLEPLGERAIASGAESAYVSDLRESFIKDYAFRALKANAEHPSGYLLSTALSRPLIAKELARIAQEEGCRLIAHGCSPKGNDQIRFETALASLGGNFEIIAPLREWEMTSREDEIHYALTHGIPVSASPERPYSVDINLWGASIRCGHLEDPWSEPGEDTHIITCPPEKAPDKPRYLEIEFEEGIPVALDGDRLGGIELVQKLNHIGGEHAIGRLDTIEDRLTGIKTREIYEAPAATILITAHKALENFVLSAELLKQKRYFSQVYAEVIYRGMWFSRLRESLDRFFDESQRFVKGKVRLKLYKGNCYVVGRKSDYTLYLYELATYGSADKFDRSSAEGFLELWSLPMKLEAQQRKIDEEH